MNEDEIREDERERVASIIEDLALALVSSDADIGATLTAAVLQRAATIARTGAPA